MVNQRPFYEHRSVLPVHSPPCAVLDKVECDLCQYLSGEEKYSQLFECFGRDATSVHCFLNAEGLPIPVKKYFLAPKRPASVRRVFLIELCQKPSQCGVLVAALPGGDDLFLLPFAHERDEDEVVGIVKAVGAVVGQE